MHAEIAEMDKTSKPKQTDQMGRMGWNDASLFLSNHSSALPPVRGIASLTSTRRTHPGIS